MSLFHSPEPRVFSKSAQADPFGRASSLRRNLQSSPLAFIGASVGLLALLGIKILVSNARTSSPAPRSNRP